MCYKARYHSSFDLHRLTSLVSLRLPAALSHKVEQCTTLSISFPFTHFLYSLPFSPSLYSFPPFPLLSLSLSFTLFPLPLSLYSVPLLFSLSSNDLKIWKKIGSKKWRFPFCHEGTPPVTSCFSFDLGRVKIMGSMGFMAEKIKKEKWTVFGWFFDGFLLVFGWFLDCFLLVFVWFWDGLWMDFARALHFECQTWEISHLSPAAWNGELNSPTHGFIIYLWRKIGCEWIADRCPFIRNLYIYMWSSLNSVKVWIAKKKIARCVAFQTFHQRW